MGTTDITDMFFQQQFMDHLYCVGKYFLQHPQCLFNRTHRYSNFKMRLPVGVNKSQVGLYVLNHSHTTLDFIVFFTAMCFGCNCKASSSLL